MNKLSESGEALLDSISSKWIENTLEKKPFNKSAIQTFVDLLYWAKGLREPEIHYAASPLAAQNIALNLKLTTKNWMNLGKSMLTGMEQRILSLPDLKNKAMYHIFGKAKRAGLAKIHIAMQIKTLLKQVFEEFAEDLRNPQWSSYYDFCCQAGYIKRRRGIIDIYCEYVSSGVFFAIYEKSHAIVCAQPSDIKFNESGLLHSDEGAAVSWDDGVKLHFHNGTALSERSTASMPDNQYGFLLLFKEKTSEIRQELLKRLGTDVFAHELRAQMIDKRHTKWGEYELIKLVIPQITTPLRYLKMLNPSTGDLHLEPVPDLDTCREALAWRDGEKEYVVPSQLT